MRTITVKLTWQEFISIIFASVLTGAAWIAVITILVVIPRHKSEASAQIETAYVKGAMVKITQQKTKCMSWVITKNGKVFCE